MSFFPWCSRACNHKSHPSFHGVWVSLKKILFHLHLTLLQPIHAYHLIIANTLFLVVLLYSFHVVSGFFLAVFFSGF
ncbi:hypothetical protein K1719_029851 [Acacia pycnantha]|nr:hypothetical protein K1719_029851 [Acacia pycnantha]